MIQITRIHVENFRSIRECTFELKDIQLLIGPNNSGKTNLLRVFEFLEQVTDSKRFFGIDLDKVRHKHIEKQSWTKDYGLPLPTPVAITLEFINVYGNHYYYYRLELFDFFRHPNASEGSYRYDDVSYNEFIGVRKEAFSDLDFAAFKIGHASEIKKSFLYCAIHRNLTQKPEDDPEKLEIKIKVPFGDQCYLSELIQSEFKTRTHQIHPGDFLKTRFLDADLQFYARELLDEFRGLKIYRVEPLYLKQAGAIAQHNSIYGNGSNIVSFLEYTIGLDRDFQKELESNLQRCIPDFKEINFYPTEIPDWDEKQKAVITKSAKYIMLKDRFGVSHHAEDVSEGTLYFLMILSIVLQPNPPQVLMLEEPETGIHPRRISEIMEYLFKLRESRPNIPIILTTHHPYVVDQFEDKPDRIWIFESTNGETRIKNLLTDVIEPTNEKLKKDEMEPIDFSRSLGEHWAMGYLGGVPETVKR